MQDLCGRSINYLRLAVTESCNFRCLYCLPGGPGQISTALLTVNEIEQVVRVAVSLGITHIRLTGGEPLLRKDILDIVRTIAAVRGVQDLALTTNAYRLPELARPLADAGLKRVNISLDTLNPARFTQITGVNEFDRVWQGIEAAEKAGFSPLKLNMVVLKGINEDEIEAFAKLTIPHPWHVRFIELMPIGVDQTAREFYAQHYFSAAEILMHIPGLQPVSTTRSNGPASEYLLHNGLGIIGLIASAGGHFCYRCNRIRITSDGQARSCLFGSDQLNLRDALSKGDEAVKEVLQLAIQSKPAHHPLGDNVTIHAKAMSEIGG